MCDIVTLGGKDNGLEPENRISILMSSALDLFDLKINRKYLPPMGSPYMWSQGGKGNVL
jgi:hypothetical protein